MLLIDQRAYVFGSACRSVAYDTQGMSIFVTDYFNTGHVLRIYRGQRALCAEQQALCVDLKQHTHTACQICVLSYNHDIVTTKHL